MEVCPDCDSRIEITEDFCAVCGRFLGPPNVRQAEAVEESTALEQRYRNALRSGSERGVTQVLKDFEEEVEESHAVVNVPLLYLYDFMNKDNALYANYYGLVQGGVRKSAQEEFDRERRSVDALIWGGLAEKIRFAALSLDGSGLKSYGDYAMRLSQVAVQNRASVLEENSFSFVKQYDLRPGEPIPLGCRATWKERHKLAVSKLVHKIKPSTRRKGYAAILLEGSSSRKTDQFIEVHIYGGFSNEAVRSVKGPSVKKKPAEQALVEVLKEHLQARGKEWEEE